MPDPKKQKVVNLNFTHNDEIWKDHVRHEVNGQLTRWPDKWGFLLAEYDQLNRDLDRQPSESGSSTPPAKWNISGQIKLPPIKKIHPAKEKFPETVAQQIGWKAQKDLTAPSFQWMQKTVGRSSILKQLNWPYEATA